MRIVMLAVMLWSSIEVAFANTIETKIKPLGLDLSFKTNKAESALNTSFWVPEQSESSHLPLLVLLDGQRYFAYATSMHHMLQQYGWAPKFAVLGINVPNRRWQTYMGQRKDMLQTLSSSVFPYLEEQHNVGQHRILFGWEAAGGFALRTIVDEPALFESYIAASPSPMYGDYFPTYIEDFQRMQTAMLDPTLSAHLYLAQGSYDYPQYLGIKELVSALHKGASPNLRWKFETIQDASHASLGFEALMRGVRDFFYYFDKPDFASFREFEKKGGHAYLDNYFKQQAHMYSFAPEVVEKNRFEVLRKLSFMLLMDAEVNKFRAFLSTLASTDFLARSHQNHIFKYAQFLLDNNDQSSALELFNYLLERHPQDARPVYGLGLVKQSKKQFEEAKTLFKQAVQMATENQDFRLPEYQQSFDKL